MSGGYEIHLPFDVVLYYIQRKIHGPKVLKLCLELFFNLCTNISIKSSDVTVPAVSENSQQRKCPQGFSEYAYKYSVWQGSYSLEHRLLPCVFKLRISQWNGRNWVRVCSSIISQVSSVS